jgi:hypothetical protein
MKETAKFIKTRPREWETVGKSLDDYPPSFDWREKGVISSVKAQSRWWLARKFCLENDLLF